MQKSQRHCFILTLLLLCSGCGDGEPNVRPTQTKAAVSHAEAKAFCDLIQNGDLEAVKKLISRRPNLANGREADGDTPLGWASVYGHVEILALLLESGADPKARSKQGGTALYVAKDSQIVSRLVDAGASVNATTDTGYTALHSAAGGDRYSSVVSLIEHGADVNATTQWGETPLHRSLDYLRDPRIVEFLLSKGAKMDALDGFGRTALHRLMGAGVVQYLGDDEKHVKTLRMLINARASISIRDKDGKTAISHAEENGCERSLAILRQGAKQ